MPVNEINRGIVRCNIRNKIFHERLSVRIGPALVFPAHRTNIPFVLLAITSPRCNPWRTGAADFYWFIYWFGSISRHRIIPEETVVLTYPVPFLLMTCIDTQVVYSKGFSVVQRIPYYLCPCIVIFWRRAGLDCPTPIWNCCCIAGIWRKPGGHGTRVKPYNNQSIILFHLPDKTGSGMRSEIFIQLFFVILKTGCSLHDGNAELDHRRTIVL